MDLKAATASAEQATPLMAAAHASVLADALRTLIGVLGGESAALRVEPPKGSWLLRLLGR
jgi:hypothetical protein